MTTKNASRKKSTNMKSKPSKQTPLAIKTKTWQTVLTPVAMIVLTTTALGFFAGLGAYNLAVTLVDQPTVKMAAVITDLTPKSDRNIGLSNIVLNTPLLIAPIPLIPSTTLNTGVFLSVVPSS